MAHGKDISGLSADQPFAEAARLVVRVRSREVFAHRKGVLDVDEIERVHAMRVATRRLRAALEVFGSCFPARAHRRALRDVKALADALGLRRDLDVQIEALEEIERSTQSEPERDATRHVIATLRKEQRQANRALRRELKRVDRRRLRRRLKRLAAT